MMTTDPILRVERAFVTHLWTQFASGRPVRCLREEHGTIAIAVTQSVPQAYQFRCSTCPWCSEWFTVVGDRLESLHATETRRNLWR